MKYPNVLFFRKIEYNYIDTILEDNKDLLNFTLNISHDKNELNKLFDSNYQILVTFGSVSEYISDVNSVIAPRMRKRWIHIDKIDDINILNNSINYCFIHNVYEKNRVTFSIFTTCYNSYSKILRAYESIKKQTFKDFEWVIIDDSEDDNHFNFLRKIFENDKRVRYYRRSENSGSIGNVKNEAVLLCRGKYLLEMDHDDEIIETLLSDTTSVFESDDEIGFIYMDYCNLYENRSNFKYGDFFALGYSGYYCKKYNDKWVYVASTPNINNITLSNIVSVPNHPRLWRKDALMMLGNYSEFLQVSDDYELLLRTALKTKMAKIHKLGYIQYMNDNNNNFSYIRNSEITRLSNKHIFPIYYNLYKINESMKKVGAYEDEKFIYSHSQIWKRENYTHNYINKIINVDHKRQYCIIGHKLLIDQYDMFKTLYENTSNDFIVLDNNLEINDLTRILDELHFDNMKCYVLKDCNYEQLENYFKLIYKSVDDFVILKDKNKFILNNDEKKKVTIITPCIRPNNLELICSSINFDIVTEWIIVYDGTLINENPLLFKEHPQISEYIISDKNSISGNAQRNYGIENVKDKNSYLYFLDDDNIIYPDLYKLFDKLEPNKIYTFDQKRPNNIFPYVDLLKGNNIELENIDTAMFLIDYNLCKNVRWIIDKYNADGYYIKECFKNNEAHWIYVDELLSFYNFLG
jgi:glycosyltransferase involved in cell wall biosynthesis